MTRLLRTLIIVGFGSTLAQLGACAASDNSGVGAAAAAGTGGASGTGTTGCSKSPDCTQCKACFDTCVCNGVEAQQCLTNCGTGTGGTGTGGSGGGTGGTGTGGTGTGGTGTGGTGTGTGGTGGTSAGGTTGFTPCTNVTTSIPLCDACIQANCCAEVEACFNDVNCRELNNCLATECAGITDDTAFNECAQSACAAYLDGVTLLNAQGQCFSTQCPNEC